MGVERWASCPECDRSVRLTESELEGKRGFCAVCDAQFEIRLGEVRDEEHPFRALAPVELAPLPAAPPRWVMELPHELHIAVPNAAGIWTPIGLGLMFGLLARTETAWVGLLGFPLCVGWTALSLARALGKERLEVKDGCLRHRAAGGLLGWTRIPVGEIRRISLESRQIRVVWRGGERVIGRWLGQDEATMFWVAQWIEHEVAHALTSPSPTD